MPPEYSTYQVAPERTGYSPTTTGPESEVTIAWRDTVQGFVTESLCLADGTLYVPSSDDARLYAFNRQDGTNLWDFEPDTDHKYASNPSVVDDTVVWGTGGEVSPGTVYAIEDGQPRWEYTTDVTMTSPLSVDGFVVVTESYDGTFLGEGGHDGPTEEYHVLDLETGQKKTDGTFFPTYGFVGEGCKLSAPSSQPDDFTFYVKTLEGIRKISRGSGWLFDDAPIGPPSEEYQHPPVIVDDSILCTLNDTVYALDASAAETHWSKQLADPLAPLTVTNDQGYLLSEDGIHCFELSSGTLVWEQTWDALLNYDITQAGGVTATESCIYLTVGTRSWSNETGLDKGTILALDSAAGTTLWQMETDAAALVPPAVTDERVFVGTTSGTVYALEETDTSAKSGDTSQGQESSQPPDETPTPGNTGESHRDIQCQDCGHSLTGEENFCPECGTDLRTSACPTCGTELSGSENFCPECGTSLK